MGRAQERVLQAVATGHRYGFEVMADSGLPSGAVYQALASLERKGYLASQWEDPRIAEQEKRPRRRYYTVTRAGADALAETAERYRSFQQAMPRHLVGEEPGYDAP